MTILMSDPSYVPPWHRVLPKPPALYDDGSTHSTFRRNSSFVPFQNPTTTGGHLDYSYGSPLGTATTSEHYQSVSPSAPGRNLSTGDQQGAEEFSRRNTVAYSTSLGGSRHTTPPRTIDPLGHTNSLLQLSAVAAASRAASVGPETTSFNKESNTGSGGGLKVPSATGTSSSSSPRPYLPSSLSESALNTNLSPPPSTEARKRSASLMATPGPGDEDSAVSRDPSPSASAERRLRQASTDVSASSNAAVVTPTAGGPTQGQSQPQAQTQPQFCLCRTDPKIPRPRNAFILYRQHNQSAVVAQNPGLANPEISKIIGKQWSELPQRVKDEWKSLAEEEKARHQQQYPDYRYQPRRYGRNSTSAVGGAESSNSGSGDRSASVVAGPSGNCLRCGGKVIMTPSTPDTTGPFSPTTPRSSQGPNSQAIQHGIPMAGGTNSMPLGAYSQRNLPPNARLSVPGPNTFSQTTSPPHSAGRVRPGDDYAPIPPQYHRDYSGATTPVSPDAKRRRFNGAGVYIPPRPPGGDIAVHGPDASHPYYAARRGSLPRPPDSNMPVMGPPPTARVYAPGQSHGDPALTLPPLQTGPATPGGTGRLSTAGLSSAQRDMAAAVGGSVEAKIMAVLPINKIKLLAKVAPPLVPGLGSPSAGPTPRGAIIAVEGTDESKVKHMVEFLSEFFRKDGEHFVVKRFDGPDLSVFHTEDRANASLRYFDMVKECHAKSKEMKEWVTSMPGMDGNGQDSKGTTTPFSVGDKPDSASSEDITMKDVTPTSTKTNMAPDDDFGSSPSPKTISRPLPQEVTNLLKAHDTPNGSTQVPIALISRYQLTTVDTAAITIPINDSYSPLDHWQWNAALMRGCIGPDITIVLREDDGPATGPGPITSGGGTNVEIRLVDARCVVVTEAKKSPPNSAGTTVKDDGIDEKALRRVGFEVDEFLRK